MKTDLVNTSPLLDLTEGSLAVPAGRGVAVLQGKRIDDIRHFDAYMERQREPQSGGSNGDPVTGGLMPGPFAGPLMGSLAGTPDGQMASLAGSQVAPSLPSRLSLNRFADEVQDKGGNLRGNAGEAPAIPQGASVQVEQVGAVDQFMGQRANEPSPAIRSAQARNPTPAAARSPLQGRDNWPMQSAPESHGTILSVVGFDDGAQTLPDCSNTAMRAAAVMTAGLPAPSGQSGQEAPVPLPSQQPLSLPMPAGGTGKVELVAAVVAGVLPALAEVRAAPGTTAASPMQTVQSAQPQTPAAKPAPQTGEAPAMPLDQPVVPSADRTLVNAKVAGDSVSHPEPGTADATDAKSVVVRPADDPGNADAVVQLETPHAGTASALTPGQMRARMQRRKSLGLDGGLPGKTSEQPQTPAIRPTQASREKALAAEVAAQAGGVVAAQPLLKPDTQNLPVAGAAISAAVAAQPAAPAGFASTPRVQSTQTLSPVVPAAATPASRAPEVVTLASPQPVDWLPAQPQPHEREVQLTAIADPAEADPPGSSPLAKATSSQMAPAAVATAVTAAVPVPAATAIPATQEARATPEAPVAVAALVAVAGAAPRIAPEIASVQMPEMSHDLPPELANPAWALTEQQQTELTLAPTSYDGPDRPGAAPAPVRLQREIRVTELAVAQVQAQEVRLAIVNTPESQIEAALKAL